MRADRRRLVAWIDRLRQVPGDRQHGVVERRITALVHRPHRLPHVGEQLGDLLPRLRVLGEKLVELGPRLRQDDDLGVVLAHGRIPCPLPLRPAKRLIASALIVTGRVPRPMIANAPDSASTMSSCVPAGKAASSSTSAPFQCARTMPKLPMLTCEATGPARVTLSPVSRSGFTTKPAR